MSNLFDLAYKRQSATPVRAPGYAEHRLTRTPIVIHNIPTPYAGEYSDQLNGTDLIEHQLVHGPPIDTPTRFGLTDLMKEWMTKPKGAIAVSAIAAQDGYTVNHEAMHAIVRKSGILNNVDRLLHQVPFTLKNRIARDYPDAINPKVLLDEAIPYSFEYTDDPQVRRFLANAVASIKDKPLNSLAKRLAAKYTKRP